MQNCTLIIPTFNRPLYLKRILSYYDDLKVPYGIIVADSSTDDIKKQNHETIASLKNSNVKYFEYRPDIYPPRKAYEALNRVETEYCLFCAEDDFVTLKGIQQSLDFLIDHPDYAIAHGHYIRYRLDNSGSRKRHFLWDVIYSHDSIASASPEARLIEYLANPALPTAYAVYHTKLLQMIYAESMSMSAFAFSEILLSLLTLIYGKMKCLDVLYYARETHPASKRDSINDYINDGTYSEKYHKFRDCLAAHLSRQSQKSVPECAAVIDKAFNAYVKRKFLEKPVKSSRANTFLNSLHLPARMNERIRSVYQNIFHNKQQKVLPAGFVASQYQPDLDMISEYVKTYLD